MCLKSIKLKLKINLLRKLKLSKSNCDSEYYGKYDELSEQYLRPLMRYLGECGIVPLCT